MAFPLFSAGEHSDARAPTAPWRQHAIGNRQRGQGLFGERRCPMALWRDARIIGAGLVALALSACASSGQAPPQHAQTGASAPVEAVVQSEAARQATAEKAQDASDPPTRPPESAR
jgi:hypothetical protein